MTHADLNFAGEGRVTGALRARPSPSSAPDRAASAAISVR